MDNSFKPLPGWEYHSESDTWTDKDGRSYNRHGEALDVATGRPRAELDAQRLSKTEGLKALGSQGTTYKLEGGDPGLLEKFPNPMKLTATSAEPWQLDTAVELVMAEPEFTSLCPLTGQPDFAKIYVKYTPREWCVESKSWKLYLFSYRSVREFHESCVTKIANDLIALLDPAYIEVRGDFTPRGGIAFRPTFCYYREA